MENIRQDALMCILEFLDIKSLIAFSSTCKKFYNFLKSQQFWQQKIKYPSYYPRHHTGGYFQYKDHSRIGHLLWSQYEFRTPFLILKALSSRITFPLDLKPKGIEDSSHDYDQDISATLKVSQRKFWSSIGSDSTQACEYLIYELPQTSVIYGIHMLLYRAVYQDGPIYPPKKVVISVGVEKGIYTYVSQQYFIEPNEYYNTFLVLPQIVIGKYFKIDLIGKIQRQPGDQLYYTVLRYVTATGFPLWKIGVQELQQYKKQQEGNNQDDPEIVQDLSTITHHLVGILQQGSWLKSVIDQLNPQREVNEVILYYLLQQKKRTGNLVMSEIQKCLQVIYYHYFSEIIGDFLFENELYHQAASCYMTRRIKLKVLKSLIKVRDASTIRNMIAYMWRVDRQTLLSVAEECGPDDLEFFKELLN